MFFRKTCQEDAGSIPVMSTWATLMKKPVYVYEDTDNNVIEVFTTLAKARAFAEECWGKEDIDSWGCTWDENDDQWEATDYAHIYKRIPK